VLVLWAGCSSSNVVPPSASLPQLLPPVAVPDRQPTLPANPAWNEHPAEDRLAWLPDEPSREWKYIVLHHTAAVSGNVESIHNAHLRNKDTSGRPWLGIGYHFVIGNGRGMNDGEIEPTFRWRRQMSGAHAGVNEYNQHGIGIVLVGNLEQSPPTDRQLDAVIRLVGELSRRHKIATTNIVGHGDVRATECPGRYFPLDIVRSRVAAVIRGGGSPLDLALAANGTSRKEWLRP
jgi:hypothetical protein